jgi:ribosomal protein RSM22 (predicted rRNA methylase)
MLVVCNLLRKAPASYAVSRRILGEINRRFPHFRPRTHLDFGAGLAPWGWGASETWKCEDTICVEPNDYMRKLSKFLNPSFTHHQTLSHTVTLPYDTFDLITIAYVLEEVASPSVRVTIL